MGTWSLLIMVGLVVAFLGLFTHWSIILIGALLPFVPVVAEIVRRRRQHARESPQDRSSAPLAGDPKRDRPD